MKHQMPSSQEIFEHLNSTTTITEISESERVNIEAYNVIADWQRGLERITAIADLIRDPQARLAALKDPKGSLTVEMIITLSDFVCDTPQGTVREDEVTYGELAAVAAVGKCEVYGYENINQAAHSVCRGSIDRILAIKKARPEIQEIIKAYAG